MINVVGEDGQNTYPVRIARYGAEGHRIEGQIGPNNGEKRENETAMNARDVEWKLRSL
jgi:hypothetical protein